MKVNTYYAGIGSRNTPDWCLKMFEELGAKLAEVGYILRSGHAKGADAAFEKGCDNTKGEKEIYIPWRGFEGCESKLIVSDQRAFEIGEKFHPNWERLSQGAQKLQARNSHQVLGLNLESPSSFIICWTEGGKGAGGTGQAIRIAKHHGIKVIDFGVFDTPEKMNADPYTYVKSMIDNI